MTTGLYASRKDKKNLSILCFLCYFQEMDILVHISGRPLHDNSYSMMWLRRIHAESIKTKLFFKHIVEPIAAWLCSESKKIKKMLPVKNQAAAKTRLVVPRACTGNIVTRCRSRWPHGVEISIIGHALRPIYRVSIPRCVLADHGYSRAKLYLYYAFSRA